MLGAIVAVSSDARHRFSKSDRASIKLIADFGIEGDAHGGPMVKHRHLAKRNPRAPNLRQVHLIQAELLDELRDAGFAVEPGELGENITTRGIDLVDLPVGSRLHLDATAVVEITGLRTPCVLIDRFKPGLTRLLVVERSDKTLTYRAGVMGIVRSGGVVSRGDTISVALPDKPWRPLPAI